VRGGGDAVLGRARRPTAPHRGFRVGAPPAVLCPPARVSPRLSPTYNLQVWCEAVGEELGEKLLEEWDDPVLELWEVTRGSGHRARWMCRECGWSFHTTVDNRTRSDRPTGCQACAGKVATEANNMALACEESGCGSLACRGSGTTP